MRYEQDHSIAPRGAPSRAAFISDAAAPPTSELPGVGVDLGRVLAFREDLKAH